VSQSARCPICGKPAQSRTRPFCSERCADIDLGRWFTGQYRIAGSPADLDDDPPPDLDRESGLG
jgi:endogenous inhibitor of DNA gyrase (YacG/DUF329 family)